jgi:peptidoglycan hydrolase-like protein with peptidoglycan-binding domain
MRYFGYWTILVALAISAVAAYYSIVGLVAIFSAAMIPIIIMGSVLEIGKLTSAVWLHLHWRQAPILIRTYLSVAVLLLMFITSMGIFGFLSKAHIQQTSLATENVAQIEIIEDSIVRIKQDVVRFETKISNFENKDDKIDTTIQDKINQEQERINTAYDGVNPSIEELNERIEKQLADREKTIEPYTRELDKIQKDLELIDMYVATENIKKLQGMIGARQDGRYGSRTAKAVKEFRQAKDERKDEILKIINNIKTQEDPVIVDARNEIKRLRALAEQQIADSNELITRLRAQLGQGQVEDSTEEIIALRDNIKASNVELGDLYSKKIALEGESRQLEAEVGPVKYIAELIYGDEATRNMLEDAVRFVMLILVCVFDPLAIVLVISGIILVERYPRPGKKTKILNEKTVQEEQTESSEDSNIREDDTDIEIEPETTKESDVQDKVLEQTLEIAEKIQEEDKEILEALAKDTESEGYLESKDTPPEIFKDVKGEEYTVDIKTGERKYVVNKVQWELNSKERSAAKKEKKELVNKIVAEMKSTGSWPGTSYMEGEGVVKKKIEQIFADDASLELKELISRADEKVLQEVYNTILKDIKK